MAEKKTRLTKTWFYILNLTWGLPLTLFGAIVALGLRITGHRARPFGWCRAFEVGEDWGGLELGLFFVRCRNSGRSLSEHEFGHALQNCIFGPVTPVLITLPSAIRYWYRRAAEKSGRRPRGGYDDIWFEGQASRLGRRYMAAIDAPRPGAGERA